VPINDRLVIVEPHSDDAFLSLGAHIEQWIQEGKQVTILTMVPVKKNSLRDAETYADAVGAYWQGYNYIGGDCDWKEMLKPVHTWPPPDSTVILPLGVAPLQQTEHTQDHWNIRQWLQYPGCWFYLEQPYALVQKHRERVNEMLAGMEVVSYAKPPARKWRHIPIFSAQAKFFYFHPAEKLKATVELIVRARRTGPLRFPRIGP
jgi:hypothetical protein